MHYAAKTEVADVEAKTIQASIAKMLTAEAFESMTLMFQTEVAERLMASPRTKAYGRLSVIAQWCCQVTRAFNVPKEAFTPPPKVSSTVVTLTPRDAPLGDTSWQSLETVTAAVTKAVQAVAKPTCRTS